MSSRALVDVATPRSARGSPPAFAQQFQASSQQWRLRVVLATATLGLAAVCGVAFFQQGGATTPPRAARRPQLQEVSRLDDSSSQFCDTFPQLTFDLPDAVVSSNLGNAGPQTEKSEGIIYQTIASGSHIGAEAGEQVYVVMHAVTPAQYKPWKPELNGMDGKYGSVSMEAGSEADFVFRFYDRHDFDVHGHEAKPYVMPQVAMTIFDLDMDKDSFSREYVELADFEDYVVTDKTEVQVTHGKDGRTRFTGSSPGDLADNPVDPMFLNDLQRNRAVTLLWSDVDSIKVTAGVGVGHVPRSFMFSFRPALQCAVTVEDDFVPPLPNIMAKGPMQVGIKCHQNEHFIHYDGVAINDTVPEGRAVVTVAAPNGPSRTYRAPAAGTIIAWHPELQPGLDLDLRLDDKTLLVIEKPFLPALATGGDIVGAGPGNDTGMDDFSYFVKYLKSVGDPVHKGEAIAVAKGKDGKEFDLLATAYGVVHERQEELDEGDPVMKVEDMNVMTLGKYPALGSSGDTNQAAARMALSPGSTFLAYHIKAGDTIRTGDAICTVITADGEQEIIRANTGGFVSDLLDIEEGTPLNRVQGEVFATVGKFPELKVRRHDVACPYTQINDPPFKGGEYINTVDLASLQFVKYNVKKGDVVKDGTQLCTLKDTMGNEHYVVAPRPGQVTHLHRHLMEGMYVMRVLQGENMVTLGPLPTTHVGSNERSAVAPERGEWAFEEWRVEVGQMVRRNAPIALLRNMQDGSMKLVRSDKAGTVEMRQDYLQKGDIVEDVLQDDVLATVGKFTEPPTSDREMCAEVPSLDCTFDFWLVHEGDAVQKDDPIAQVSCAQRRLRAMPHTNARRLAGSPIQIVAPASGTINYLPDLTPGETIGSQSTSRSIARVDMGTSMLTKVGFGAAGVVALAAGAAVVLKRKASYKKVPPEA